MTDEQKAAIERALKLLEDLRKVFEADGGDDIWQMHIRQSIVDLNGTLGRKVAWEKKPET